MERAKKDSSLLDLVFSWSIEDVLNKDLYREKVKRIPKTFSSTDNYMNSFKYPLFEETREDLYSSVTNLSQSKTCEILSIDPHKDYKLPNDLFYNVEVKRLQDTENDVHTYEPEIGDLFGLMDESPTCMDNLHSSNGRYLIASVIRKNENSQNEYSDVIKIVTSMPINLEEYMQDNKERKTHFAVFLINMITNTRIWKALNQDLEGGNMVIIKEVLQPDNAVGENCSVCYSKEKHRIDVSSLGATIRSFDLNDSQEEAVLSCIAARECNHQSAIKLVWGPPGTGKTKTVASFLYALLQRKCRTLTCTPTNVAVLEVTTRFLRLVKGPPGYQSYGCGDIVLYGNEKRMKIDDHDDLIDVFLDYRVYKLLQCLAPSSGWKHCLDSMISLLEDPEQEYIKYLQNQDMIGSVENNDADDEDKDDQEIGINNKLHNNIEIEKNDAQKFKSQNQNIWMRIIAQTVRESKNKKKWKEKLRFQKENLSKHNKKEDKEVVFHNCKIGKTFHEFFRWNFDKLFKQMDIFVVPMYTHLPTSFIPLNMVNRIYESFIQLEKLREALIGYEGEEQTVANFTRWFMPSMVRKECLQILMSLRRTFSVPDCASEPQVRNFCLKNARMLFCTASGSARLHTEGNQRLEMLIIDEASQLKECEAAIPLQLCGLKHVILIGDERQLPALVKSKISERAGLGRSLFERLVLLDHKKHLLNVQYRMHPSISLFPKKEFYDGQVLDAPSVKAKSYEKHFLDGDMYNSYSFINVGYGQDERDDSIWRSQKNLVEVAVVSEIVANLWKESIAKKQRVSVGVISPYSAQVHAIKKKLGLMCNTGTASNFRVSVRTVDGFQGGEEDIIIISTVRCNAMGIVGFVSNPQRTNVALTRARHCLWVVGNGATLINSDSVWERLVIDSKARGCFHNAEEDKSLAQAIATALLELGQLDNVFNMNSLIFRKARWKVCFSGGFLTSLEAIKNTDIHKEVLSLLMKLSSGWRQPQKEIVHNVMNGDSCILLNEYKVNARLYLIWTIDILEENSNYNQVLRVWDILQHSEIPKLAKHIDIFYGKYLVDMMNFCRYKYVDGNFELPATWPIDSNDARMSDLPHDDLVQSLCYQFASLSLRDESER